MDKKYFFKTIIIILSVFVLLFFNCGKSPEKAPKLVCSESGWEIEGEKGKPKSSSSSSWRYYGKYDTGGEGIINCYETTVKYDSGKEYEITINSWRVFEEDKGWVTYSKVSATGGLFGSDTVDCSY